MNGQALTKGVIPFLPSGDYAIFKNNVLADLIGVDNGDNACLIAVIGSDEIFYEEGYLNGTVTQDDEWVIISSELVKLN